MKLLRNQAGVSLIELIMAISIIAILAVVLGDFFVDRLHNYHREFTQTILQSNTKQAVETLVRDIKSAQVVESVNRWPDNNSGSGSCLPYCWNSTATIPSTIVLAVPSKDASGNLLYVDTLHNVLRTDDIVYYVEPVSNILYRRTIANPDSQNVAKTTCPPAIATAACPADAKVVEDVASLEAGYLDTAGNVTATPSNAGSVKITLQQSRTVFNQTYTSLLTSQATLRNK